jgi:hypothetical protein
MVSETNMGKVLPFLLILGIASTRASDIYVYMEQRVHLNYD